MANWLFNWSTCSFIKDESANQENAVAAVKLSEGIVCD